LVTPLLELESGSKGNIADWMTSLAGNEYLHLKRQKMAGLSQSRYG
jgi:hypothetical protein